MHRGVQITDWSVGLFSKFFGSLNTLVGVVQLSEHGVGQKGFIRALKQVCNKLISEIHRFLGEFVSFTGGKQSREFGRFSAAYLYYHSRSRLSALSMHHSHTASLVLQQQQQHQQLFATLFLWQWLFLPPIVRLNPSLSLSVYLSPSLHAASIFLFWHQTALSSPAPPSLILPTSNNSLSSVSPPFSLPPHPPLSYRVHRILTALSGTMATRKLL